MQRLYQMMRPNRYGGCYIIHPVGSPIEVNFTSELKLWRFIDA
ncbi:MAG: hypothetical protein RIB93_16725 [Coleofasciculus sp. D1-CHI-01]